MSGKKLLIVIPCYNEEEALPSTLKRMETLMNKMLGEKLIDKNSRVMFVDDGSADNTWQILKKGVGKTPFFEALRLSRNFGHQSAILAGMFDNEADIYVTIDADLQDPPELIIEMYETLQTTDYDCVASRRVSRKGESKIRSFFARMFYKVIRKISKVNIMDGARDFRMMTRQMTDAVLSLREYNRFSKGIFAWVGFNTKWIPFENRNREAGTTKWSFWGLLVYAIDGILAFSTAPLALSAILGLAFCAIAIIMIFVIIWKTLAFGDKVAGWPSLACILCFTAGISMFCNGVIGLYVSKTYSEVKGRPQYILKDEKVKSQQKSLSEK